MTDLTQYVQAGACVRSGGTPGVFGMAVGCALERGDCEGTIFRSSRELLSEGSETVGYLCLDRTIDTRVGRCEDDSNYVCTSNAESCADENGFLPLSEDCSMLVDRSPQRKQNRTYFGGCTDVAFPFATKCYWSEADCDSEEFDDVQWISAGSNSHCTCEATLTGACENNGEYYCAVSEFGCDDDSTFIPVAQLPEDLSCFLCEKLDDSVIEMKSAQIVEQVPSTPQLASENQPAPQANSSTEPQQDAEPESSPEKNIPTTTSGPADSTAKAPRYEAHLEKDNDTVALYIGLPTMLLFTLLLCCAITCTGSKAPERKSPAEEDEGLVASPKGELA
eukprot:CAMPEP_0113604158 /NCGR_PEP_ID=MMETSP0017_2-20120614/1651_1 /TAXON_ID=2856 /ORGANISM="Cylindrotheca closterium" /LENGTH=334 /DNA_ID=CAMNT_0000512575 /DNA_START=16 /DNA_END=1020 /DNA_ORIENTATION=+ /assembly_acc=CAM_ASM_000147